MLLLDFTTSEFKQQSLECLLSFTVATPKIAARGQRCTIRESFLFSDAEKYRKEERNLLNSHHDAGVELVETLHGAIAEAVAQVFLDKVGVVQNVIGHQRLLSTEQTAFKIEERQRNSSIKKK